MKKKTVHKQKVKVRCHICELEKECSSWAEFLGHLKEHIKRGEHENLPVPGISGNLIGTSEVTRDEGCKILH